MCFFHLSPTTVWNSHETGISSVHSFHKARNFYSVLRDRSLFIAWRGAEDLGGIRWLREELRGGSAVIDRRKGGIRPKKWNFRSRVDPRGGGALCKYLVRVGRRDSIKTPTLGWGGGIMTSFTTDKGGSLQN